MATHKLIVVTATANTFGQLIQKVYVDLSEEEALARYAAERSANEKPIVDDVIEFDEYFTIRSRDGSPIRKGVIQGDGKR